MEEDYVSFETAKLAKENGFDEKVKYYFTKNGDNILTNYFYLVQPKYLHGFPCPTQSFLAKWIRQTKNLIINIFYDHNKKYFWGAITEIGIPIKYSFTIENNKTYKDALEESLKIALTRKIKSK